MSCCSTQSQEQEACDRKSRSPRSTRRFLGSRHFLSFVLFFALLDCCSANMHKQQQPQRTHYQVLELDDPKTATLSDIKKAYRKLALKHHPDRNPPEQKEASTIQFRAVSEAYEVLSDPQQRREYDESLRYGSSGGGSHHRPVHRHHDFRDPFGQFNDLFANDPFFQEAFRDMDDLFAKTFQAEHGMASSVPAKKSWGHWIADWFGIDLQISTSTTQIGPDGRPVTSRTQTHYGNNNQASTRRTYTSKSTRTVIENGQRVTIQSMEKDGNTIEERFVNNKLTQRLINGIPEHQYKLQGEL